MKLDTYLMMKLFAFRDWETKKQNPSYARKHALDLYAIVAMMTEEEFTMAEASRQKYGHTSVAQEAAQIANDFFSKGTAIGCVRLREHQDFTRDEHMVEFIAVLNDLFPHEALPTLSRTDQVR